MSVITKMLKQEAVYWPPASLDSYGQLFWGEPEEITCRWEDVSVEFIAESGEREMSRAKVFVDRDIQVKGVLLLGELSSSVNQDDPKANEGAWEIRRFEKLPNFKATEFVRTAFL